MGNNGYSAGAHNPKDPLNTVLDTPTKELLRKFAAAAHGFGFDAVIAAAASVLVTGVRQCYAKRADAEARYDQVFGQSKQTLLNCYDASTGNRFNIFPHRQVVTPPLVEPDDVMGKDMAKKRG